MYELFVDNQRFFRRYFSLSDLAEDKRALLRDVLREEGGGEGIRVLLSQLVFGAVFALWGAACGSLAKIAEKTTLEIFLFQLVFPSYFGQEIFYFHPRGETVFTQHFFSVVRTLVFAKRTCMPFYSLATKESVSRLHCIVGEIGIFVAKKGGIGMPSDIWFCTSRRDVARAGATQYLNC